MTRRQLFARVCGLVGGALTAKVSLPQPLSVFIDGREVCASVIPQLSRGGIYARPRLTSITECWPERVIPASNWDLLETRDIIGQTERFMRVPFSFRES